MGTDSEDQQYYNYAEGEGQDKRFFDNNEDNSEFISCVSNASTCTDDAQNNNSFDSYDFERSQNYIDSNDDEDPSYHSEEGLWADDDDDDDDDETNIVSKEEWESDGLVEDDDDEDDDFDDEVTAEDDDDDFDDEVTAEEAGEPVQAALDDVDLSSKTVPQLKELLKEKGLPVSGRKAELIERLTDSA
mmetsp:Transcript_15402/g.25373  ORF Transcript_15402/g.25373 Transcript_15402/m.25373 type:complete len:188 (-) Transcript_15402:34-597(-)